MDDLIVEVEHQNGAYYKVWIKFAIISLMIIDFLGIFTWYRWKWSRCEIWARVRLKNTDLHWFSSFNFSSFPSRKILFSENRLRLPSEVGNVKNLSTGDSCEVCWLIVWKYWTKKKKISSLGFCKTQRWWTIWLVVSDNKNVQRRIFRCWYKK